MLKKTGLFMLAAIFCCSAVLLVSNLAEQNREKEQYESIQESFEVPETTTAAEETEAEVELEEPPYEMPSVLSELMENNENVIGWLRIEGFQYLDPGYPIMQNVDDNEYYLHRDIDGNKSVSGSIYMDSEHSINENGLHTIYGHHMKNNTMFGYVADMLNPSVMEEHQNITVYTDERQIDLKPVYCYAGEADGSYRSIIRSKSGLEDFLLQKTGMSIEAENVFVLITCDYSGNDSRAYLICVEK